MAPLALNSRIGRDNVSKWVRGVVLPLPHHLAVLCRIFECQPPDLMPPPPLPKEDTLRYTEHFDGTAELYINRTFPTVWKRRTACRADTNRTNRPPYP
jgi:hypothetical protein